MTTEKQFEKMVSEAHIISEISDKQSLDLFKAVALTWEGNSDTIRKKSKLTPKQYYRKMSSMIEVGLIRRVNKKYFLTSLGKVVYKAQTMIESAINEYWKLIAIDSLESSINAERLSDAERKKILESLVENQEIREIILSKEKFIIKKPQYRFNKRK
jgi:hypothetical protein